MTKFEIFADVVALMTTDYAGLKENQVDPGTFTARITEAMDDTEFEYVVQDYLMAFPDGHVGLTVNDGASAGIGFGVRRFQNSLVVTDVFDDERLHLGDMIVAIDEESIETLGNQHAAELDPILHRQTWKWLLQRGRSITLNDGRLLELHEFDNDYSPAHVFEMLNDQTGYMRLTDFWNPADTDKVVADNAEALAKLDYLIVDTRLNLGGNDMAYWNLLAYFVDEQENLDDHYPKGFGYVTHWTQRNKDNWLGELKKLKAQYNNQTVDDMYASQVAYWESAETANTTVEEEEVSEPYVLEPKGHLKHVYVLSDYMAGSAGDNFIMLAKTFAKVTVLGRNTMGIVDYGNVAPQKYPNFTVHYPTTRLELIDVGQGTNGVGFAPDIELPWTPKSLFEDTDLQAVLELIEINAVSKM
ncbi:S41 family peptidase [Periweissella cryptocerci]|nr:S41 family peptidase [Periweissella cryptocerci]